MYGKFKHQKALVYKAKARNPVQLKLNKSLREASYAEAQDVPKLIERLVNYIASNNLYLTDKLIMPFSYIRDKLHDRMVSTALAWQPDRGASLPTFLLSCTRQYLGNLRTELKRRRRLLALYSPQKRSYEHDWDDDNLTPDRRDDLCQLVFNLSDPRERKIVWYRMHGFTLEQISTKFNVTRQRIKQIEKRALKKLRPVVEDLLNT